MYVSLIDLKNNQNFFLLKIKKKKTKILNFLKNKEKVTVQKRWLVNDLKVQTDFSFVFRGVVSFLQKFITKNIA